MKSMFKEPGLWLVVFGMILFAGIGNCWTSTIPPEVTTKEVTQRYDDILYTIKVVTTCTLSETLEKVCTYKYYHLVGHDKTDQVLISISNAFPDTDYLRLVIGKYLLAIEEGI